MDVQYYPLVIKQDYLHYDFCSEGPKGKILKTIWYRPIQLEPERIFNVSLQDFDEVTNKLNTSVISNNGDRDKVLMTVAQSVIVFCRQFPGVYVVARGGTPARTRLYRMMISKHLIEIEKQFLVYGLVGTIADHFRKNQNYDGFMVSTRVN